MIVWIFTGHRYRITSFHPINLIYREYIGIFQAKSMFYYKYYEIYNEYFVHIIFDTILL